MTPTSRTLTRLTALLATVVVTVVGAVVPTATSAVADTRPVLPGDPPTVSADALPTVQIDGVVWDQVIVDEVVYVAGDFTTARPAGAAPGVGTVPRGNLLAFDLNTGELLAGWSPSTNGQVLAIEVSPDGSRLYIGGSFTRVNGASVWRIAALDRASGALIPSFVPKPDATVRAIAVTEDTVYFGGLFNAIATEPRPALAAVTTGGDLLPWAPAANGGSGVNAVVVAPDRSSVVVGGSFTSLNGSNQPGYGLGAVHPVSGELLPFEANMQWIRNGGRNGAITHLSGDDDYVYGSGYTFGRSSGTLEGTFAATWDGGELAWIDDCHGDTYSAFPVGDVIYQASHKHYCGNQGGFPQTEPWEMRLATAITKDVRGVITPEPYDYTDFAGNPRPDQLAWYPDMDTGTYTGQNQGPWSVVGTDDYVVMGGEFLNVEGRRQQGLVRFAVTEQAPNSTGPRVTGGRFDLSATSTERGVVRLRWTANHDPDNEELTYSLVRNSNVAAPIHEVTQTSRFYDRPTMGYVDTGLTPGSSQRYRLRATDPFGNLAWSDTVTVEVATAPAAAASNYAEAVLADEPDAYWRAGEPSGSWLRDASGWDDLRVRGNGVTLGRPGAIPGDPDTALALDGSSGAYATTTPNVESPKDFTVEAWIRTTATRGGRIVGYSSAESGTSNYSDRHLYMDDRGRLVFGIRPYSGRTRLQLMSTESYNDGTWHHVVATADDSGTRLYVDGVRVADGAATAGRMYGGYWRIGGDSLQGWTSRPTNDAFTGDVDEVAVYSRALSHEAIRAHLTAAGGDAPVVVPADAYGAAVVSHGPELYWRLDEASGSTAADSGQYDAPGTYRGTVTRGVPGALDGVGSAASFNGTDARVTSNRTWPSPSVYSTELWFSTTSTAGGTLIGLGNSQTGTSTQYDRQVVMDADGRLTFSVLVGNTWTRVTSPEPYDDGDWHHLVATQSADGMVLYVDGAAVGSDPQSGNRNLTGYWKVGGDTSGLGQAYFAGQVDEVAVYAKALDAETVAQHHALATGQVVSLPPTAEFTAEVDGLTVSLDGSASTDPDGSVEDHAWDLGDGTSASGATATHTYDAAGTYTVTLTVTDDSGETGVAAQEVTVEPAPIGPLAADAFDRVSSVGWGVADAGGSWAHQGNIADFTVSDGTGRIRIPTAGASRGALLAGVLTTGADVSATLATTTVVDGGGAFLSLIGRRIGSTDYRAKTKIDANGAVTLYLSRTMGGETTLNSMVVPGLTFAAGDALRVRHEAVGTSPTVLRAKVWRAGTTEPAVWQLTATDDAPGLQGPGGVGILGYVSGSATTVPVVLTVDDLVAVPPGVELPAENLEPVAAFTATVTGLVASFDASSSSDPDGTLTGYEWDFGGGATATGVTTTHTFPAAGTYPVTLTVRDDDDATASVTHEVTVTVPGPDPGDGADDPNPEPDPDPDPTELASDTFARTVTGGWGAAQTGGAWTTIGPSAVFDVADGAGRMTLPRSGYGVTSVLDQVSSTTTDVAATFATPTLADGGGSFVSLLGRRVDGADYRAKVKIEQSGAATLYLTRAVGGETTLGALSVPGVSYAPGDALRVRLTVSGTSPTTLQAKVWEDGQSEPDDWQLTATDDTAVLQAAGGVGVMGYLAGSATTAPFLITVDDLVARTLGEPLPVENVPPTPAFTVTTDGLDATFDASGTTDPDGEVALYGWDFGDGTFGTGVTPTHGYAEAGTYSVTLTATDDDGDAASVTHTVTVGDAEPAPGEPPVAAFELELDGATVQVDGASSTDADGLVETWSWDFGDGATAEGVTAEHTYTESGLYTIFLRVTDDDGEAASASRVVEVTVPQDPAPQDPAPGDDALAQDDFARTVSNGWGAAPVGGGWTTVGASSSFTVTDGVGRMTLPRAGSGVSAYLPAAPVADVDARTTVVLPVLADGGGAFVSLAARRVGGADYRAKVKVLANGSLTLYLTRADGGETNLDVVAIPGVRLSAGQPLHVRFEVTGTAPTTLQARVWPDGSSEPTTWHATATDSTPALQGAGGVGVVSYLAGSASTAPYVVEIDDLEVRERTAP